MSLQLNIQRYHFALVFKHPAKKISRNTGYKAGSTGYVYFFSTPLILTSTLFKNKKKTILSQLNATIYTHCTIIILQIKLININAPIFFKPCF